ncbi:MAG: ATP-binding cassette domain-containing protein [Planctomycetota bacterium]
MSFFQSYTFLILAVFLCMPLLVSGTYYLYLFSLLILYSIAAIGLSIFTSATHKQLFSQAAFMGVSAYIVALVLQALGDWNGLPAISLSISVVILAALASAIFGFLISFPAVRLAGPSFAMVTLAIAWISWSIAIQWQPVTGGELGLREFFPLAKSEVEQRLFYLGILVAFLGLILLYRRVFSSAFGLFHAAYRDDAIALAALGVRESDFSRLLLFLATALAGLAGGLFALQQDFVNPDSFEVFDGVLIAIAALIGGLRNVAGPILGVFIVFILPEFFHNLAEYRLLFYGFLVLVILNIARDGILPSTRDQAWRHKSNFNDSRNEKLTYIEQASSLEIIGMSRNFGHVKAITSVSADIREGEIHGIIGPNGSGKTTLLDLVSGFVERDEGKIAINAYNVSEQGISDHVGVGICRTFQKIRNFEGLTCRENLLVALFAHRFRLSLPGMCRSMFARHSQEQESLIAEHLHAFDLSDIADVDAGNLSQGQKRMLELARVTIVPPRVLLLDEPTSGLDKQEIETLKQAVQRCSQSGTLILLVDHNLSFVSSVCATVTALSDGEVIASGSPSVVLSSQQVVDVYYGGLEHVDA